MLVAGAAALALPAQVEALPVLTSGHTDVGVNYENGAWDLHVHAEDLGEEYEPGGVWIKVGATSRTSIPGSAAFSFLGASGSPIWVLPAVQKSDLVFLGLGTEELAAGVFSNNVVNLALKSVRGPGGLVVYQLDTFGSPVVSFNSLDGIDANDARALAAGGHTHVNWVFTAPGQYRIGFQASGMLAATGETTTSEIVEYLFDVGEGPALKITQAGAEAKLEFLSETNATYQIQYCAALGTNVWENLGLAITGTGSKVEERFALQSPGGFYRAQVNYGAGVNLGVLARLFIADATNAALSMIDLETGVVSPELFTLNSRATLGSTPNARYCLAVELDGDKAELFDSGIYVEDHGDHWHYYQENAHRMSISLLGDNPVHTVSRGGWLTLHWDLTGRVDIFNETQLAVLGNAYVPSVIMAGAQHGSAVPVGTNQFFAISKPNPLYPVTVPNPLPVGVDVWDLATSNRVHSVSGYSNMHGEAGNGRTAAFGFTQGVLLLWQSENGWTNYMVTNPPTMPASYRIGDLRGHDSSEWYYGLSFLSETAGDMFLINATNLSMEKVALPGDSFAVAYEFSPDGAIFGVVLANGDFLKLDAKTARVIGSRTSLIAPSTRHENHGQYHPGLAMGLGRAYITDPAGQQVLEVDLETLSTLRTFPLNGMPTKVTLHGVLVAPTR